MLRLDEFRAIWHSMGGFGVGPLEKTRMCRFLLYMGAPVSMASLVTEPQNSLINQSFQAKLRAEPLNGDGFGIAWYMPHIDSKPALFKSISPAWNNQNLQNIARVTHSPCILAHVRAATFARTVNESNCHPFTWKHYAFCHNGDVGGFGQLRRKLLEHLSQEAYDVVLGNTDSEHFFALVVDYMLKMPDGTDPMTAMVNSMNSAIAHVIKLQEELGIEEKNYMNFGFTDGTRAVVTHCTTDKPKEADSLFVHTGGQYSHVKGRTQIITRANVQRTGAGSVIVSSEPLTEDPGWRPVKINEMVVIDADMSVTTRDIPAAIAAAEAA